MNRDEGSHEQRPPRDDAGDEAWLSRVRDVYEPQAMSAAERAAFDARLEQRIERAGRRRWLVPVAGPILVAAMAALLWVTLPPQAQDDPSLTPTRVVKATPIARPESLRAWQHEVVAVADRTSIDGLEPEIADLPADYQALDSMLLAGGQGGGHAH